MLTPHDLPRTRRAIRATTALGSPRVAATTVGLLAGAVMPIGSHRAAARVVLSAGVVPATWALKRRWGPTPRFRATVERHPVIANYPSGHAAFVTAVYGQLGLIARREGHPGVAVAAGLVVAGAGVARSIDGSHLPSDVLGGHLLGAAWLLLVDAACGRETAVAIRRTLDRADP